MGLKKLISRKSSSLKSSLKKYDSARDISETTTCSSQTSSKVLTLENLAQEGRFTSFIAFIHTDWYDDSEESTTPLHICLQNGASLAVIEEVIAAMKEIVPEETLDASGRTPLHIAANHGCCKEIIERLLQGESIVMPALIKDHDGRYPLHWACAKGYDKGGFLGKQVNQHDVWNRRNLITILLDVDGECATVADKFGKTPLEYATENKLSHTIIRDLKREHLRSGGNDLAVDKYEMEAMSGLEVTARNQLHDDCSTIGFHEIVADDPLAPCFDTPTATPSKVTLTSSQKISAAAPPIPRFVSNNDYAEEEC